MGANDSRSLNGLRDHGSTVLRSSQQINQLQGSSSIAPTCVFQSPLSRQGSISSSSDNFSRPLQGHRHRNATNTQSPQSSLLSSRVYQQAVLQPPSPSVENRQSLALRHFSASSLSSSPDVRNFSAEGASPFTTGSQGSFSPVVIRPRAGTIGDTTSSSGLSDHELVFPSSSSQSSAVGRIQESRTMDCQAASGIPTSLSAELSGLGLNISDLYPAPAFPLYEQRLPPRLTWPESSLSTTPKDTSRRPMTLPGNRLG
jgi:hypothetical protein